MGQDYKSLISYFFTHLLYACLKLSLRLHTPKAACIDNRTRVFKISELCCT